MNIISIDRIPACHGDYQGMVRLSYDEVVMIRNALYHAQKNPDMRGRKRYKPLYNDWSDFGDMLCYGKICSVRECEKEEVDNK